MDGLIHCRVWLFEDIVLQLEDEELCFECWAENREHALEQCQNAYPHCVIQYVELI